MKNEVQTETMPTISFKAFLTSDENGEKIEEPLGRRFKLNHNDAYDFLIFKNKLEQIYPALNRRQYVVFWKGKT